MREVPCVVLAAGLALMSVVGTGCSGGDSTQHDAQGIAKDQEEVEIGLGSTSDEEWMKKAIRNAPHPPIVPSRLLEADTADLQQTVVVPHTRAPVPAGKNALWCATWQLCWDAMCDEVVKGPIKLGSPAPPAFATEMNRRAFPPDALDTSSYLAVAGRERDGIVALIRKELKERFSVEMRLAPGSGKELNTVAYAFLRKSLPFERLFDPHPYPIKFAGGTKKVLAFGLDHDSVNPDADAILGQVNVLREKAGDGFGEPEEFVLEIAVKGGKDRLILACVPPAATLEGTWEDIRPSVEAGRGERLRKGVTLVVPKMNFDLRHSFREIIGAPINIDLDTVDIAEQTVRFSLDEGGALLDSHAILGSLGVSSSYVVNRPFLLALLEKGKMSPYLLLWIANDELLAEAAK